MTGIFDFVREIIKFAYEHDLCGIVEQVLRSSLYENTNKNFQEWIVRKHSLLDIYVDEIGNEHFGFNDFDIDALKKLYSSFHDLDHAVKNHDVWNRTSYMIIRQLEKFFNNHFDMKQEELIHEREFRTLRKYVPAIMADYILRYYKKDKHGYYRLKEKIQNDRKIQSNGRT